MSKSGRLMMKHSKKVGKADSECLLYVNQKGKEG